jgi:hypothetical protein
MVNVDALVGYISVIVEGFFAVCMLAAKIYLDNWGPYSKKAKRTSGAASGLTIPARARLEMNKFLSGTAGAPFPKLMQAEEAHAAAHLLLDCQLEFREEEIRSNKGKSINETIERPSLSEVENGTSPAPAALAGRLMHTKSHIARQHLRDFVDMLETCLENADLDVYKRQTHAFASFKQRQTQPSFTLDTTKNATTITTNTTNTTTTSSSAPNLCFIPVKDGYCSAMWLPESSTLAVDLVGVAPETIQGMNVASEMFCRELTKKYPDAKIVASAVSRLPAQ